MSPRARVTVVVAAAAAAAAVVAVGAAMLQSSGGTSAEQHEAAAPRREPPPLLLDLGVRDDREARELRRALDLYERGRLGAARPLFARHDSLNAQVGLALAAWPEGTTARLRRLSALHPRSALVRVNLGLALEWEGRRREALAAWRAEPPDDPLPELRDPGLLRLFFGADPRPLAEARRERHREKLRDYEALLESAGPSMDPGPRLALEAGIAHERVWIDFWRSLA